VTRTCLAVLLCLGLIACGGGGGSRGGGTTPPPPPGGGGSNPPATTPPGAPSAVAAGATAVDITVPGPSTSPAVNATLLGAAGGQTATTQSAFSTGDFVHRGTIQSVILFGAGLSANDVPSVTSVRIGGSGDVTVVPGSLQGIHSSGTPSTPGIAFQVSVPASAALGARTVYMVVGNDMTVFAGGLEVVP
jgi:hypothetical protein